MGSTPTFVHLNVHSQYSLLESTVRLDALVRRARELNMPAVALTDTFNLFGAVHFYRQALAHGVKPILGCEVGVAPESRFEKSNPHGRPDAAYRLILLAENNEGYANLVRLCSLAQLEGFFHVPRVDKKLLAAHSKGLIALSSCLEGEVSGFILKDEIPLAVKAAEEYREIFGKGSFFLEIQDHGLPGERKVVASRLEVSRQTGILPVATNGVRYLRREGAKAQEALLCLGKGMTLGDPAHPVQGPPEYFLKSAEEMSDVFRSLPEALTRAVEIAERCHVEMDFKKTRMPGFPVPAGGESENQFLERLCLEGLARRYGAQAPAEVERRLVDEIRTIEKTRFSGYFLIVWDFIRHAREAGIPVGPGRGSAAGSLAAYCLGITDVDPIRYDLLFERFINPERVSAPDIDVDVSDRDRGKVLRYIRERYGEDRVAAIVTFGTMAARAVVRDMGRVLGLAPGDVDRIAKLVPPEPHITLEEAIGRNAELKSLASSSGPARELLEYARALEGQIRHVSTHAAGVLIGDEPLVGLVPLCRGAGDEVLTQYDMDSLKEVGLLKLDVLGLRTLTVIEDCLQLVEGTSGRRPDLSRAELDDPVTYALLREAHTLGVFQLESRGMRDYLRKLEPSGIEDLIALLALYRPGPLGSDMVDDFIRRKKGQVKVSYPHPLLEPILKNTYGVILYQEQVMRIAADLGGFTLGQADLLRRAMGKKDPEEMEAARGRFKTGARARGIPEGTAEAVFDQMAKFAGYGFNKSHSAAYAMLAFQTAYLKAHHGPEFMAALLTSEIGDQDRIARYAYECRRMGIPLLPPDVNESSDTFTVTPAGQVRFSLLALRNVGAPAVKAILEAREAGGAFPDLFAFCRRVDMRVFNPRMLASLVQSGAFDAGGARRSQMMEAVERVARQALNLQNDKARGQTSLFDPGQGAGEEAAFQPLEEAPSPLLLRWEKESLGFYLSGHPLSQHEAELEHYTVPLGEAAERPDGVQVRVAGLVRSVQPGRTKRSNEDYARFQVEDLHTHLDGVAWPEVYRKARNLLAAERLVAVLGVMDQSGNTPQLVAQEVIGLEEMAEKWARSVVLTVNLVGVDERLLERLKELCARYPGSARVTFHLQSPHLGEVRVEAGEERKVRPTGEFLEEAVLLLGEDSVEIEM